jgi:hypothetical protein
MPEQSAELVESDDRSARQVDQPVAYPPWPTNDCQQITLTHRAGACAASFAVLSGAAWERRAPERQQTRFLETTGALRSIALASQDNAVVELSPGRGRSHLLSWRTRRVDC